MKINSFLILIWLLSPNNAFAGEVKLHLANEFATQNKYIEALKLVAPCLVENASESIANLEDCLYTGEHIAKKAIKSLGIKQLQTLHAKGFNSSDYAAREEVMAEIVGPYEELGLTPFYINSTEEFHYKNEFFEKLSNLFPISKYRAEYEYELMNNNASVNYWEDWINNLENYIKEFPKGAFSLRAKYDLAHNYDDLWSLVHPDHEGGFQPVVKFPKDEKLAEEYKQKALKLYESILMTKDTTGLTTYTIEWIRKRIPALKNNEIGAGLAILRGYD